MSTSEQGLAVTTTMNFFSFDRITCSVCLVQATSEHRDSSTDYYQYRESSRHSSAWSSRQDVKTTSRRHDRTKSHTSRTHAEVLLLLLLSVH